MKKFIEAAKSKGWINIEKMSVKELLNLENIFITIGGIPTPAEVRAEAKKQGIEL